MMKLRLEADVKFSPNGLPARKALFGLAEARAAAYFREMNKMTVF
jgi:hypothetical protein